MKKNSIVITDLDYQRLTALLSDGSFRRKASPDNLSRLARELDRAKKVDPRKVAPDVVTMNTEIEFTDMDNQISKKLKLVYPERADIRQGYVSVMAPIGTALLGFRKGDVIEWEVPAGKKKFLIKDIIYQPEASGHYSD
ncbi:MAG: nucleoside diphosphate kinase regulator [Bacteroidales bacterium]